MNKESKSDNTLEVDVSINNKDLQNKVLGKIITMMKSDTKKEKGTQKIKFLSSFFLLVMLISFNQGKAQQVDRNIVILEIGTGTWCFNCPGAAMGADDLTHNDKKVGVIEYHDNDEYANSFSDARNNIYGIGGLPTSIFDGTTKIIGGSNTTSLYPDFLSLYDSLITVPSSFTIEMQGNHIGLSEYEIIVTVTKVAPVANTNLVLHLTLTESEIEHPWLGQEKLHFVERSMYPDDSGTVLDFSTDDVNEITLNFTVDPSWENQNCELVAFVQDPLTKEIFQGMKNGLIEIESSNTVDASVISVIAPSHLCVENLTPQIQIANYGSDMITDLDIVYQMNNGTESTHHWSGNLNYLQEEFLTLPEINFDLLESNSLNVSVNNPNGVSDQNLQNDTLTFTIDKSKLVSNTVELSLKLDDHPSETSWEILNALDQIIYSGNNYTTPEEYINEAFDLILNECYTFKMYDQGGNGLFGSGLWNLIYDGTSILANGKEFGHESSVQFEISCVFRSL